MLLFCFQNAAEQPPKQYLPQHNPPQIHPENPCNTYQPLNHQPHQPMPPQMPIDPNNLHQQQTQPHSYVTSLAASSSGTTPGATSMLQQAGQPGLPTPNNYIDQNGDDSNMSNPDWTLDTPGSGGEAGGSLKLDGNNLDCKICAVKNKSMSEYLKHLSKVHFKNKLLTMVPKSRPYKCPWVGCEVVKKDRYNISLHYGMTHKVALKLMQEMPEDALNEDVEAVCKLCHQSFTAHRYLYTHLADSHFQVCYFFYTIFFTSD